jgi:hypothetical protein
MGGSKICNTHGNSDDREGKMRLDDFFPAMYKGGIYCPSSEVYQRAS